jgi:hypothetical protein
MPEMTEQVRRAIRQMREAGFERREFSVQVERHWYTDRRTGRAYTFGDAIITLLGGRALEQKAVDLTPAIIATGLGVIHYKLESGTILVIITTDYKMRGKFELYDVEQRAREAEAILELCSERAKKYDWGD